MRTNLCLLLFVVGCSSSEPGITPNGAAEDVFSVTRVSIDNGVAKVVGTSTITRGDQVSLAQQREGGTRSGSPLRQAIGQDPLCADQDLWLFDQTNLQGNELCLYGAGTTNLGYLRGSSSWLAAVRSYWAGSEYGTFYECYELVCLSESFVPYQREYTVSDIVATANAVQLNP